MGYEDWDDLLENYIDERSLTERDKAFIEHMGVFFKNGEKYNLDYCHNTITVDTLNDYAQVIYANRQNITYAKRLHSNNIWASDYVLAYLPNYNYFGLDWFRTMLRRHIRLTRSAFVRMALYNYLSLSGCVFCQQKREIPPQHGQAEALLCRIQKRTSLHGFLSR